MKKGFTIPELLVVIGVAGILMAIATTTLLTSESKTSLSTTVDVLISDLKAQQVKSMSQDTEGRAFPSTYGAYFEPNRYTLFYDTYSLNGPGTLVINLEDTFQFENILFPSSQVLFATNSGEITGFVSGSDSVTIRDTVTGEQRTIRMNRYGAVTQIN